MCVIGHNAIQEHQLNITKTMADEAALLNDDQLLGSENTSASHDHYPVYDVPYMTESDDTRCNVGIKLHRQQDRMPVRPPPSYSCRPQEQHSQMIVPAVPVVYESFMGQYILACVVTCLCCWILGLIAFILASKYTLLCTNMPMPPEGNRQ